MDRVLGFDIELASAKADEPVSPKKVKACEEWLRNLLSSEGEVPAVEVFKGADLEGYSLLPSSGRRPRLGKKSRLFGYIPNRGATVKGSGHGATKSHATYGGDRMINSLKMDQSALKGITADTLKIGGQNILILLRFEPIIFLWVSDTLRPNLRVSGIGALHARAREGRHDRAV